MNIVNRLTLRQLALNRKRTLVTVVGVIISVAMITAVASIGISFLDFMRRATEVSEGGWHVCYHQVGPAALEGLRADTAAEKLLLSRSLGYAPLPGATDESDRPYLFLEAFDDVALREQPFRLLEGRLPENENELALTRSLQEDVGEALAIGRTVELSVGLRYEDSAEDDAPLWQNSRLVTDDAGRAAERLEPLFTRSYTVVGYIESSESDRPWSPGFSAITWLDPATVTDAAPADAWVVLRHPNSGLFTHAEELAGQLGIAKVSFHNSLLRYMGLIANDAVRSMLLSVSAVVMVIIIVGSVSLIYNAFSISVAERSRYLGMLASVGATRRQKRASVFFEGAVIGAVSIPIGLLSGLGGIAVTFHCIDPLVQRMLNNILDTHLRLVVSPLSLVGAVLLSAGTILLSVWLPARQASRISPVEAIRQTTDLKLTRRAVKTLPITRWLFGFEAELGLKNLKRNRRRYRATVFSLVVSVVLFLTVSYFTDCIRRSLDMYQVGVNYDVIAYPYVSSGDGSMHGSANEEAAALLATAQAQGDLITQSARVSEAYLYLAVEEPWRGDQMPSAQEQPEDQLWEGKTVGSLTLLGLEDAELERIAKAMGVDPALFADPEHPAAVYLPVYHAREGVQFVERTALQAPQGAQAPLLWLSHPGEGSEEPPSLQQSGTLTLVGAYRGELPMGVTVEGQESGSVQCLTSHRVVQAVAEKAGGSGIRTCLYLSSNDPMALQRRLAELRVGNARLTITNLYRIRQDNENMLTLVSVFLYGFILLITAVCVANIFNTISTSVALRRREFAMLKSVGMSPKSFRKMIRWESLFYGIKSLLYGLPLSFLIMAAIHYLLTDVFAYPFTLPWRDLLIAVLGVFLVVAAAMGYAGAKTKKDNIVETLRQESF